MNHVIFYPDDESRETLQRIYADLERVDPKRIYDPKMQRLKSLVHKLRSGCDDKTLVELYVAIEGNS